jgi:hypothetical protein
MSEIAERYDKTQSAVNPRTEIPLRDTQDTKPLIASHTVCNIVNVNYQEKHYRLLFMVFYFYYFY